MPVVALLAEGLVAFCALAFEVIAARLIAPHAGMSTDTWTAIIGAFLLALALGNRIGGALAASDSPAILLRRASLAAACGGLAVTVAPFAMTAWDGLVLASAPTALWRIVLFAAIPCIPAGLCFGIATPLLMMSVLRATDARGAFVGSSYLYANAHDWARFGQFLLQNGVWNGQLVLPPGFVEWMHEEAPASEGGYGRGQVWLHGPRGNTPEDQHSDTGFTLPDDAYWMLGHDGQTTTIIPSEGLVVVRLGLTPSKLGYKPQAMVQALVAALK